MNIHQPYLSGGARPIFQPGGAMGCLCLHGFSAAPTEIFWLADHLHHTLGMTTYSARLTGHGTDPADMNRMRWRDWYLSARDGYQLLADQCEQVFIAGVSMGGLLTLLLAAADDIHPAAAAVIAAPLSFSDVNVYRAKWIKLYRRQAPMPDQSNLPQIVREEQRKRGEPVIGRTHYTTWSVSAVAEMQTLSEVARDHLDHIRTPLTLIYAEQDKAVPLACSDEIASQVNSPEVVQHTLKQSGHVITQDTEREQAFQMVESFFRRYT